MKVDSLKRTARLRQEEEELKIKIQKESEDKNKLINEKIKQEDNI
jgi:hypothetical protein